MTLAYIFWTTSSEKEAKSISKELLEQKLIACANIIPKIQSLYIWEGKLQEESEVKVILKTNPDHFSKIEELILEKCSYEVPEITMMLSNKAHFPYSEWIEKNSH